MLNSLNPDDWTDNSRDILNFLLNYLPVHPATKSLPMHLVCLPDSLATSRRAFGFQSRTFVVIGHSFGGCTRYVCSCQLWQSCVRSPLTF